MKLKELLDNKEFQRNANVGLILMKLLEDCGVEKKEILSEKHDDPITNARKKIYEQFGFDYENQLNKEIKLDN